MTSAELLKFVKESAVNNLHNRISENKRKKKVVKINKNNDKCEIGNKK